ncbi:MAG TPA: FliH/SctL family protein [Stellaceae bacterium]|nr:FliH/SctL family protein [Stellaceae bacterium]
MRRWQFPLLDSEEPPSPPPEPLPAMALPPPAPDFDALARAMAERAEAAHAEAVERGLAEGRERGYAAGLEAVQPLERRLVEQIERLNGILGRFDAPVAVLQRPVEEAVAALALEIARCVIGAEVSRSHAYLVRLIREAIARVPIEMGTPKILLNPADLDLVRELAPDIDDKRAALVSDETVEPGGCLVIADGDDTPVVDRRWHPRAGEGMSQVDLTLASRWRSVILTLFAGEED